MTNNAKNTPSKNTDFKNTGSINTGSINKEAINKEKVFLRQATANDIGTLEQLLNLCYRQDQGWTNEAGLVGGIRTTQAELASIIATPKHYVFVYPQTDTGAREGEETGVLLGCIAVEFRENPSLGSDAYIGMFAVHPKLQGAGIGNVILRAAETFAERHLLGDNNTSTQPSTQTKRLTMSILSHRPELLAYYERRGYQLTNRSEPFPIDGNNGEPKRDDLALLELAKLLNN